MQVVDLRSDTITHPTPEMRKAMAEAEVGDDVFGDDPTVNRLERMAADMMGKEAAVFVSSGTMGNLVSLLAQCGRGDEIILGDRSHTFLYEQGGSSALGGIHPHILANRPDGTLDLGEMEAAIRADNVHFPRTRLIALENTHNRCAGSPLSLDYMRSVKNVAERHGLAVHLDGARIFNASVALGVSARELAASADSVTFCLSKGLAAPVGSLVCGCAEFIAKARRVRKVLGGGMRQAGILAAAGIVALTTMVDRLAEDHANARTLVQGLAEIPGIVVHPDKVTTNIMYLELNHATVTPAVLVEKLETHGVRMLATSPRQLRAVTNCHVTADGIEQTLSAFRKIFG